VNTKIPSYEGLHDITSCDLPPNRRPLLVNRVDDRIGTLALPVDHEKIIGIVGMNITILSCIFTFLFMYFIYYPLYIDLFS
jgi:acyl-CoA hydrolase